MSDNIKKKCYLLQTVKRSSIVVFVLSVESCVCCGALNASTLTEPSDVANGDLFIVLFAVAVALLLTVSLVCILRWCFKKQYLPSCQKRSSESGSRADARVNEYEVRDNEGQRVQIYKRTGGHSVESCHDDQEVHPRGRIPIIVQPPENVAAQACSSRSSQFTTETQRGGASRQLPTESRKDTGSRMFSTETRNEDPNSQNISNTLRPAGYTNDSLPLGLPAGCSDKYGSHHSFHPILSRLSEDTFGLVNPFEGSMQELLIPTERSVVRKVSGKLLAYITHEVDSKGGSLILDNMGVSLHIPRNAVPLGMKYPITLALNWELSDAPPLEIAQAQVSPVIYCGPHSLKLEKSCILSYKHCAYDPQNVVIMASESDIMDEKGWIKLCSAKEDGGKCVVTEDECHVRLDHFSLITSTHSPTEGDSDKKWLQVAVFGSTLVSAVRHYQIRVYFFNNTPCNLQWAIYHEAQFGGKLVCPEKTFLFNGTGEDIHIKLQYLSDNWVPVDENGLETVSFLKIWHNHCPHASMCFKRSSQQPQPQAAGQDRVDEINIHFLIHQNHQEHTTEKLIIHMVEDRTTLGMAEMMTTKQVTNIRVESTSQSGTPGSPVVIVRSNTGAPHDDIDLDDIQRSLSEKQTIPTLLKHQLVLMLDPRCPFHHDWRELAARLDLDRVIPFLESKYSPTSIILQHMENKGKTLLDLYGILKDMEREDAASFVEKYLMNPPNRSAVEGDAYWRLDCSKYCNILTHLHMVHLTKRSIVESSKY